MRIQDRFIGYLVSVGSPDYRPVHDRVLLQQLAQTAFLMSNTVTHIIWVTVPSLLRQLSRVNEPKRAELHGQIRGRIDWAATTKHRLSQENDPTLFVCRQIHRQYATPENELLKAMLEHLKTLAEDVPLLLRNGVYWSAHSPVRPAFIQEGLGRCYERLFTYLSHVFLREVETPPRITTQHLLRARSSKTEQYGDVAALYEAYRRLVILRHPDDLFSMIRQCIVLPEHAGGAGDAMVRLVAQALATR